MNNYLLMGIIICALLTVIVSVALIGMNSENSYNQGFSEGIAFQNCMVGYECTDRELVAEQCVREQGVS